MKPRDFRDLRFIAREVTAWARDIERARVPHGQAGQAQAQIRPAPERAPALPAEYSYVRCKDCDTAAILLHATKARTFAAYCPECMLITHLDTIDQEKEKEKPK